jgi:uncharacterized protein
VSRREEPGLSDKIAALRRPHTYPEPPAEIEAIETHMSWVFLSERFAYKLKKPVRYDFLDFGSLAARRHNCAEEVRLNRRLAPDVYFGSVPLVVTAGGELRLEAQGEPVEWLVKMRRLPADRMLDRLIREGRLQDTEIRATAVLLGEFYRRSPPVGLGASEYWGRLHAGVRETFRELNRPDFCLPAELVGISHDLQMSLLARQPELFDRRVTAGHIVEGHGDLRPEHICLEERPIVFDCLEFNRDFRIIDPADELAFLALECERLGAPEVGARFIAFYTECTGDRPPESLMRFYMAFRASLRAKLAIWHTREVEPVLHEHWHTRAVEYLKLAAEHARRL